jgi:ribosome-associated protein YbcJ (S4-like RNA binding protein)
MELKMRLEGDSVELAQLLKNTGLLESRSMAEHIIVDGLVKIDGTVVQDPQSRVEKGQTVEMNGTVVRIE